MQANHEAKTACQDRGPGLPRDLSWGAAGGPGPRPRHGEAETVRTGRSVVPEPWEALSPANAVADSVAKPFAISKPHSESNPHPVSDPDSDADSRSVPGVPRRHLLEQRASGRCPDRSQLGRHRLLPRE